MIRALKRRLALGVAVVALVSGGAIAAVSATGQSSPRKAAAAHRLARRGGMRMLASAASYLGISQSQLESELRGGKTLAQIANATSGRSEAGLIEALIIARKARLSKSVASLPQRVSAEVNRPLLGNTAKGSTAHRGIRATARGYLGLSAAQLRSELRSGMTLAQIADGTPGKSEAGLIEAIVAARTRRLNAAVAAGKLTTARESADISRLNTRVKALVNRAHAKKSAG
ncbi:MAG TPA: hypothetical protein VHT29_10785 [Solirubrobacteraceae bacterium]|jgi:hypothetical protein|nr:hypothetical protein [Solirubrobacteraceae bacterium]